MNIALIEQNVKQVLLTSNQETFIFDLLLAYGKPKASINRLQASGTSSYNLSKEAGVVLWKSNVCFVATEPGNCEAVVERCKASDAVAKHKPRFLFATDFVDLVAFDAKANETLRIPFVSLSAHFDFFLPWAGMEKSRHASDNPADVKAAEKMAKLYDIIEADNPTTSAKEKHSLNVFLSRILFCFFAEDTEIFPKKLFTNSVESHTSKDGSDLSEYLDTLFVVLNTKDTKNFPAYLQTFPYVNGGLFAEKHPVPQFSKRSRDLLIQCGADLNWSEINPDIFGSMIQAVVDVEQRSSMGMHYTSVQNIMKVIEPLFLTELREEFEKNKKSQKKLEELLQRLTQINVFDPACGSGNFLIIAYKEIRKLEMEIINQLCELNRQADFGLSAIQLSQFYGIELDDFAHEVAILSMWLAEHQMNLVFLSKFGRALPTLPLKPSGNIVCANATVIDWEDVCPRSDKKTVYLLGNPPYLGARNQSVEQKAELSGVFEGHDDYKDSDYVSAWILKGAKYIRDTDSKFAFVTTNSICQGEQVSYIWPRVLAQGLEIDFAHQQFKWSNRAKKNAGVACVIVGVRRVSKKPKYIFHDGTRATVSNVSPYLTEGTDTCVARTSEIISDLPVMMIGSMARDGGNLIMKAEQKDEIVARYPNSLPLFKMLTGTNEFIKGEFRWCLWIEDEQLDLARSIPPVWARVQAVKKFRADSKAKTTNEYAKIPHKFAQRCYRELPSIVVPSTTSERREYVPIGYLQPGVVITNSANAIYDASTFVFGLVSSKLHIVWVRGIGGELESRLRYSAEVCYNTFPVPKVSSAQKKAVEVAAIRVLDRREQYSDLSIEVLYDPDTMPEDLKAAHAALDEAVDRIYKPRGFANDEDRLEHLLRLYEDMREAHA